jgi:hypothetical protein
MNKRKEKKRAGHKRGKGRPNPLKNPDGSPRFPLAGFGLDDVAATLMVQFALARTTPKERMLIAALIPMALTIIRSVPHATAADIVLEIRGVGKDELFPDETKPTA